jgi:hypothetical protein
MGTARRRPRPAYLPGEKRGRVTIGYLGLYAHDEAFGRALLGLYATHCTAQEPLLARMPDLWRVQQVAWRDSLEGDWARGYIAAVAEAVRTFGLDRLGEAPPGDDQPEDDQPEDDFDGGFRMPRGVEVIHSWCHLRASMAQASGPAWSPVMFADGVGFDVLRPDLGEVVRRDEFLVRGQGGEPVLLVDERREPVVRVRVDDRWDPREEPIAAARARLLATAARQVDAELERIAADAEAHRYEFPDTTPKARQHLRWLFEHVALKKSYYQIAQDRLGGWQRASRVYNRVKPYADLLGIALGRDR